jgi:H+/Cl- antiporter ClcA
MSAVASPPDPASGARPGVRALKLVLVGAVLGVPSALLAAAFLAVVHELEHWLWTDLPHDLGTNGPPWYLVIGLPVVGAAVCAVARMLLPGDGGHLPLKGLSGGGPTPLIHAPGIALAAIGTLSFGAVLGPEGPLIALGSVAGLLVATLARAGEKERAVLAAAGSFAAIAALFGGPIVGGLMMVEGGVGLGAALVPMLIPGFVAAATGYVLFIGLGSWGGLNSQAIAVPGLPAYTGTHVLDLLIGVAVGVAAALVVSTVRRYAGELEQRGPKRVGTPQLLLAGGLAVGLLAQIAQWLGANSQDVLFSGQSGIPDLIAQSSTKIVVILLLAKAIGYSVSLGSGFRGGPVFPAIFLGVALATLAEIWFGVSPTLAVAVGTAAGMAATTRLMLTPIVFSALLVGHNGADTVSAAVLAAAAAWLTLAVLDRRPARADSSQSAPATTATSSASGT